LRSINLEAAPARLCTIRHFYAAQVAYLCICHIIPVSLNGQCQPKVQI
jgi:hypothetical protein